MSTHGSPAPEPNLFLIGAAKCATTSMWSYLDAHPEIFMSDPKEPGYFDGTHDLAAEADWYASLFEEGADHPVRGEASTTYTRDRSFPGAAQRINERVPSAKLLYLIREPIERMRSHYLMRSRRGQTEGTFEEVLRRKSEYIEISSYGRQVSEYLSYFDRSRLLILRAEDLRDAPVERVQAAFEFLGVGPLDATPQEWAVLNAKPAGEQRRPVRLPKGLRRARRYLRPPPRARQFLKRHVTTRAADSELVLSPAYERELLEHFRADFTRLREVVGPDMDLYDLA